MLNKNSLRNEQLLYLFLLLTAGLVRFVGLGSLSLSDYEAVIALHAYQLANGLMIIESTGHPLLAGLAGLLFSVFNDNNFWARFFPALIGSLFVLTPYFFRDDLGKGVSLGMALWLAIDPLAIYLSRQMNGVLIGLFFLILTFQAIRTNKQVTAGFMAALMLLSGPGLWWGLVPLGLSIFLFREQTQQHWKLHFSYRFLASLFVSLMMVSSLGLVWQEQIGSIFGGLISYIQGWQGEPDLTIFEALTGLLVYELPVLIWGMISIGKNLRKRSYFEGFLSVLVLFSLVHFLIYPGRTLNLLTWVILPMMLIAVKGLLSYFRKTVRSEKWTTVFGALQFVLLVFVALIFLSSFSPSWQMNAGTGAKFLMIGGGLMLILVSAFLIGWGWSWQLALKSFLTGLMGIFLIMSFSGTWNLSGLRSPYHNEMWSLSRVPIDTDLMNTTLENIMEWNLLDTDSLQIIALMPEIPSIKWFLRDFQQNVYLNEIPAEVQADIILTTEGETLTVSEGFRGQDFLWTSKPAWDLMLPGEWQTWFLTRRAPQDMLSQTQLILWADNNLFPGNETN